MVAFSLGLAALSVPVFYHSVVEDFLFLLGITRDVQHIEEFPGYECRRVQHGLIEGCEDLWLDHEDRKLYAACGDVESRRIWCPATSGLNFTAKKGLDHFSILNIDEPGTDVLFGLRALEISGDYKGATGGKQLDLHGFDVRSVDDSRLRFWMVNH